MVKVYRNLFESYLQICKCAGRPDMTSEELEGACIVCNSFNEQLVGMIDLLEQCGEMSPEEKEKEFNCVNREFSTRKLYHAYIERGEVYIFR